VGVDIIIHTAETYIMYEYISPPENGDRVDANAAPAATALQNVCTYNIISGLQ